MVKGQSADRSEIARTLQRLILFAAALVAVVLLALGAAHLPSLRNRALAYAQDYAARELGIQLRASGLAYSLLDGSVDGERPVQDHRRIAGQSLDDESGKRTFEVDDEVSGVR